MPLPILGLYTDAAASVQQMANPNFKVPGYPNPWPAGEVAGYHITHLENLPSMIETGAIKCDRRRKAESISNKGIAHEHIKARRDATVVKVAQGGTLSDYTPFYFAPRSPMLYAIHTGYVDGYNGGQREVVHLVVAVAEVAIPHEFVVTDGHAEQALSSQFGTLDGLDEVDWNIMHTKYWLDTDEDGDRKRRRQAEFLVHDEVPFNAVRLIGVCDEDPRAEVANMLAGTGFEPEIRIRKDWYY